MLRRVLLICGVVSSLLYLVSIDALAAILYPEAHAYRSQMVSELIAIGAPTRPLLVALLVPYNVLVFAFAAGVWWSSGRRLGTRLTAVWLGAYGATSSAGLLIAPMNLRTAGFTDQTMLHIWTTAAQGLFIVLALAFGAFTGDRRFRRYTMETLALCLVFGAWASVQAAQTSPWIGLTERVSIYAWMLWLVALALSLWHAQSAAGATHVTSSKDGTRIGYLSLGAGPSVVVVPGVLSMASDYTAFARALAEHFTVHTIERRGRGVSGPQGDHYSVAKECEDVCAVQAATGASLLVGHSYGGLVALEVARLSGAFTRIAIYEPGISIGGSMPTAWMPAYEQQLADGRRVDALVTFTLADAPPRIRRIPRWLMKGLVILLAGTSRQYRQMLYLLEANLREWREIARLDGTYERYAGITASVLLLYGGKSDSTAVDLVVERLPAVLHNVETKKFGALDHFGIERTAPREVARAVTEFFLKPLVAVRPPRTVPRAPDQTYGAPTAAATGHARYTTHSR